MRLKINITQKTIQQCIKCQTAFCWLCGEIIDDAPVPNHYKDPNSACKGKQFEGMEDEGGGHIPRWILCTIILVVLLFIVPSVALGIALGAICMLAISIDMWCII